MKAARIRPRKHRPMAIASTGDGGSSPARYAPAVSYLRDSIDAPPVVIDLQTLVPADRDMLPVADGAPAGRPDAG